MSCPTAGGHATFGGAGDGTSNRAGKQRVGSVQAARQRRMHARGPRDAGLPVTAGEELPRQSCGRDLFGTPGGCWAGRVCPLGQQQRGGEQECAGDGDGGEGAGECGEDAPDHHERGL